MTRLDKVSLKTIKIFMLLFAFLFSVGNVFFTVEYMETSSIRIDLLSLLYSLVAIIAIRKSNFSEIINKIEKFLLALLIIIVAISGMFYIFSNNQHLIAIDDQYNVFDAAVRLSNGDISAVGFKSYISVYPNNIGLLSYFFLIVKIFGVNSSLLVIRIINLLAVIAGYFYIYKITDLLFNSNKINVVLLVLLLLNMQFVFYSKIVYGNAISYSFSIMSIYYFVLFIKENKKEFIYFSMTLILISIFIKQNSLIVFIAEIIYLFIDFIKNKSCYTLIIIVSMLLGCCVCVGGIQVYWSNKAEIDYSKTKLPTICWVANGINYDSRNPGRYTNQFEVYHMANDLVPEYTAIEAKRFINDAVTYFKENPKAGLEFYAKKFLVSFANPTYECLDEENIVLETIWDASSSIVAIGLVMFLIKDYKKMELYQLIGIVVVIGGFLFHAFWETKAVYCYQYYLFLLPYAACGLKKLFDICSSKK